MMCHVPLIYIKSALRLQQLQTVLWCTVGGCPMHSWKCNTYEQNTNVWETMHSGWNINTMTHIALTSYIKASLTQKAAAAAPGGDNALSVVEHTPLGPCTPENHSWCNKINKIYINMINNVVIQLGVTTYLQYTLWMPWGYDNSRRRTISLLVAEKVHHILQMLPWPWQNMIKIHAL